ncbi:hypothetical protein J2Z38_001020 [Anaerococcus degeneri]|nr:hypothetical protein [Anaerococcus degeneri]
MKTRKYWIKVNIAKIKFPDKIKENEQKGRRLI